MGILSKITPRFFKKVVRKVGRAIKSVTKPIRKVLRKVLKPIGKAFDKLGWVGTLALMIWGGPIGAWFSSWLGSFGTAFMQGITKAMPKLGGFLANIGKGIRTAATWTKNTFSSITDVMAKGVNRIAEGFGWNPAAHGGRTLTDAFGDWASRVRDKIQNFGKQKTNDPMSMIDPKLQPENMFREEVWDPKELKFKTPEFDPLASADVAVDVIDPVTKLPVGVEEIKPTADWTDTTKAMEAGVPQYKDRFPRMKEWWDEGGGPILQGLGKAKTKFTASPIGKATELGIAGYGAYEMFKGSPSYEEPYYNANTSLSNAMLSETEQPTYMDELAFNGNFGSPQQDFNTMAQNYITGFGYALPSNTTDYMNFAQNLPGYGYQFSDYLQDSLYGQQNPYYTG